MAVKTTGAEFKAWLASDWGADAWWDDYVLIIDGAEVDDYDEEKLADDAKIVIDSGVVYLDDTGEKSKSATAHFNAWKKSQTHTIVMVTLPKNELDEFKKLVESMGFKVSK
jgi:hypothetical protein